MALEVTPGSASAESYASIAEINAYAGKRGASFPIDDAAVAEAAARRATSWLDGAYRDRFLGQPASSQQALEWPRTGVMFRGQELPGDSIPRQVVDALCEAAIREMAEPNSLAPDVTRAEKLASQRVKAGPVETEERYAEMKSVADALPVVVAVDRILAPLLRPVHGGSVDVLRF